MGFLKEKHLIFFGKFSRYKWHRQMVQWNKTQFHPVPSKSCLKSMDCSLFKTLISYHEKKTPVKNTDQEEQQLQPQSQPQKAPNQLRINMD